ncbi:ferulate-5-hydroxylase [Aspergillus arachidicola]|uniref:Ferulate-5-hydroxylase n=1 Tax=Aspergillus arachidicola TaxID=656916 RepID=A0A2G7FSF5_9EURO|nr:ferulate-5-hydroxylase [Aspergillus arachidicola]
MQIVDMATSFPAQVLVSFGLLIFVLLCPWFGYLRLPSFMRWWPSIPSGPISALRLTLKEYSGSRSSEDGYKAFSKKAEPFAICNPSFYPQVLLPPEQIPWLLSQPDNVLSHEKANEDVHALPFLAPAFDNYDHLELIRAIRTDLTRNIPNTEDAFLDELRHTTDEVLGAPDDNTWKEVKLTAALDSIIFGICLRLFFGVSLSRNRKFVYYVKMFTRVTGAMMLFVSQLVPWPLKPVVGLIAGFPIYYYWVRLIIYLYPTFKERIQLLRTKKGTPPADMVTWMVDLAMSQNPTRKVHISALIVRLTLIVFLPVDVLIAMTENFFLDLLSSDPDRKYYNTLRQEADAAFTNRDKSQPISQSMLYMESTIRESLRLSPLSDRMLSRRVVQKGGITLPDGQFLPRGTWLAVAAVGIHRDEQNYEDPDEYRPLRFLSEDTETKEAKAMLVPVTSEKFLAFGHGRHSCPGRWFAAHAMKLIIGYILMNYDIEPLEKRPMNSVVGQTIIPQLDVKIRVRRRE